MLVYHSIFFVSAASLIMLPLNYLVSSSGDAVGSPLAESSLNVLLILLHYRKCMSDASLKNKDDNCNSDSLYREHLPEEGTVFSKNPFCKAVENVRDIECMNLGIGRFYHLNDI